MNFKKTKVLLYKEGFSYPIENNILIDSEALYNQSLLERDVNKLWATKKDNSDLIKYLLIGGGVILVVIVLFSILNKQPPPTT